ncbi:MAG TPA: hypothetical protein VFC56_15695 [Stellaceae bacterium]|nr:hypothetical protein [Stellaceae bacterium]
MNRIDLQGRVAIRAVVPPMRRRNSGRIEAPTLPPSRRNLLHLAIGAANYTSTGL